MRLFLNLRGVIWEVLVGMVLGGAEANPTSEDRENRLNEAKSEELISGGANSRKRILDSISSGSEEKPE